MDTSPLLLGLPLLEEAQIVLWFLRSGLCMLQVKSRIQASDTGHWVHWLGLVLFKSAFSSCSIPSSRGGMFGFAVGKANTKLRAQIGVAGFRDPN